MLEELRLEDRQPLDKEQRLQEEGQLAGAELPLPTPLEAAVTTPANAEDIPASQPATSVMLTDIPDT